MGDLVRVDFTVPARPRRPVQRYVRRCDRCRVPLAAGRFCGGCLARIDAEGDVLRYERLAAEAARMCCACLWPIPARSQMAVDENLDCLHVQCAEERALKAIDEQEAEQAGGESA